MRIVFVQLGRIGDMILATPAFEAVHNTFPDYKIDVITGRHNYQPIYNNPAINSVMVFDKSPGKILHTLFSLKKKTYDYLIDPKDHRSTESRIIARLIKAKNKVGYDPECKAYNIRVAGEAENEGKHYIIRYYQGLASLGIGIPDLIPKPVLYLSPGSEEYLDKLLNGLPRKKLIALNISASAEKKMWDNDLWVKFLKNIDWSEFNIVLSYAPSEKDRAKALLSLEPNLTEFVSRSFNDITSLIAKADLLITPDTAVVHVASAFDKPLLGLYSGLDDYYSKFAPLSTVQEIVRAEPGDWGIKSIRTSQVIEAFGRISERL